MHPACPNKKQNHLQNSLLRWTQFWVRKTFSKPASLKRASLVHHAVSHNCFRRPMQLEDMVTWNSHQRRHGKKTALSNGSNQGAACCCVHLVAFCSSFPPLQILGCICDRNSLENIMGKKDASGCYVSRLIAEYPLKLAESFANIAASLLIQTAKIFLFPKRWHHFL